MERRYGNKSHEVKQLLEGEGLKHESPHFYLRDELERFSRNF